MKVIKRVFLGFVAVIVILIIGFTIWANNTAQPASAALQALQSDAQVTVTQQNDFIIFEPADSQSTIGFVFYPGGRVDYRAYSPVLRKIAERGYFVALLKVNLNLAFFDVKAANKVISQYPAIDHWVVGGHSLGGVAASLFASENQNRVQGLALWASYPSDDSLTNATIKVISIYGTKDMAGMEPFDRSRSLLPADAQYIVIDGGNHAQFGAYGIQAGDNPADISAEEQWRQVADAMVNFLEKLKEK